MQHALVDFKFSGGLADEGFMDYYHAARFDYGAARLLLKLQYFLDEGTALHRVSKRVDADFRILAEERGSWIRKVLDFTAEKAKGSGAFEVPVSVLLAMLNNRMSKKGLMADSVEQVRQLRVSDENEERVKQQLINNVSKFSSPLYSEQKKYIEEQENKILELGVEFRNLYSQVREYREVLETVTNSDETIKEHWNAAGKIGAEDLDKIIFVNRSSVQDIVYPVRCGSVDRLTANNDNEHVKIIFNRQNSEAYFGEVIDRELTHYEGRVKNLDFETGWGKFRSDSFFAPMGFQIPKKSMKRDLSILSEVANKEGKVKMSFHNVNDVNGNIIRLIYDSIVEF